MAEKSGSGCVKSCAVGCVSIVGLFLVLAVGAWMGRDTLRQTGWFKRIADQVETVKSEVTQMNALGARLAELYPAEAIPIRMHMQSESGKTVKALVVTFVNPGFALAESASAKEAKAREIAWAIAREYPSLGGYDQLQLSFVTRSAGGVSLGSTSEFQFPTVELLAKPTTPP